MPIVERERSDGTVAFLAQIDLQRKGKRYRDNRTFDKRKAAEAWIKKRTKEIEALLAAGINPIKPRVAKITLGDAIDKYVSTHVGDVGKTKAQCLRTIRDEYDISDLTCDQVTSTHIVTLAEELHSRPDVKSPSTVLNYLSHLGAVFTISKPAWGYPLDATAHRDAILVCGRLGLTRKSKSRDRRPTIDELERLLEAFETASNADPRTMPMHKIAIFGLLSTRRQSEITRIEWRDLNVSDSQVLVRSMKHPGDKIGNDVWCDLPEQAVKVALSMPRKPDDDRVFPFNPQTVSARWTRACAFLGIEDLHFHDLRHEGVTRLFEMGLTIPKVASFSGHRSWSSLQGYTHLKQSGDKYADWDWLERAAV